MANLTTTTTTDLFSGVAVESSDDVIPELSWERYWQDNISLYLVVLILVGGVIAMHVLESKWQKWQNKYEKATGVMKKGQAFSADLVAHFLPTAVHQKHQFRGMSGNRETIDISFTDLALEIPSGARVLKGVSGVFQGARMCAIMGPSGAGKTTFMNVLCGKATYGKMSGSIAMNGREINIQELCSVVGFVPQDDIVYEDLTVREQINFSARLRNPRRFSSRRLRYITDDVLHIMQVEHIQNSIVGGVENRGISGGQRKRVNIGLELAAQPTILFLDEPTSGLDSTSSLAVALSLKRMCQLGMSSIMVIHQPRYSLFTLFDDVLLLGKGGQTVYLGPSIGVKRYFESLGFAMPSNENPADWFMDVICGEMKSVKIAHFKPELLFDLWNQNKEEVAEQNFDDSESIEGEYAVMSNLRIEQAVLRDSLEEEWKKIDLDKNGIVDAKELQELLAKCSQSVPDKEVVHDLMNRMVGEGASEVSKEQFLNYLCSLGEEVAQDLALSPAHHRGSSMRQTINAFADFLRPSMHRSIGRSTGSERGGCDPDDSDRSDDGESSYSSDDEEQQSDMLSGSENSNAAGRTLTVSRMRKRKFPGFYGQVRTMLVRRLVQWWRMSKQRAIFMLALVFGAVLFAVLYRYIAMAPLWDATPLLYLHTALALLLAIFSLHVFGQDQPIFWRERARGLNVFAYFVARILINLLDLIILRTVFTCVFYIVRQPQLPYGLWEQPFTLTALAASGWGYLISTLVAPRHGPFIVTLVIFVENALLGDYSNLDIFLQGGPSEFIVSALSITRWTVGMSFTYGVDHLDPTPAPHGLKQQAGLALQKRVYFKRDWGVGPWWTATCAMLLNTLVLYILSYVFLRLRNRDKQV